MAQQGFTLLEVLVVLAIIGILASIGFFSYLNWARKTQADAIAAEIGRIFTKAQARVRTTNKTADVTISTSGKKIDVTVNGTTTSYPLDVTSMTLACRSTCAGGTVKMLAPYGYLTNDVKIGFTYAGNARNVFMSGPTALLRIAKP